jgi:SAM-dependent methyltransferase
MCASFDHPQVEKIDWDYAYRQGTPEWDSGVPSEALVRIVERGIIKPCRAIEIGCGTGADAVYLAQKGFEMTAVEASPMAMERARTRAQRARVLINFILDDVFEYTAEAEKHAFVYDAGFYHFIRNQDLEAFLDMLWRLTFPGSHYLTIAGSDQETAEGGPPRLGEETIRAELGRLFEVVDLRPCRMGSPRRAEGYLGWSCLMKRPEAFH